MGTEQRDFRLEDGAEPGRVIRGRIESPADAERSGALLPHVLVLHGFKGFMDWGFFPTLSTRIARAGFVAVSFNFSGSGVGEDLASFSDDAAFEGNTVSRELEDVELVRAFVREAIPWADPARVGLVGHSLGGAIALLSAERTGDVAGIALWSPIGTLERYDAATLELWRARGFLEVLNARTQQRHRMGIGWLEDVERNRAAYDLRAVAARASTPAIMIHGARDESVPLAEARELHSAFRPGLVELCVLEGANHTFGAVHPFVGATPSLDEALRATLRALRSGLVPGEDERAGEEPV